MADNTFVWQGKTWTWDPTDPEVTAAYAAYAAADAQAYFESMYGKEGAEVYMQNYLHQEANKGGSGALADAFAAQDTLQPKAKYGNKDDAPKAKKPVTNVANLATRHDGVQSFTDQTKPGTKKDKWGWWS